MPEDQEQEATSNRAYLVAGLVMLSVAGLLWLYGRSRPCPCGERQVGDIAQASAEIKEQLSGE